MSSDPPRSAFEPLDEQAIARLRTLDPDGRLGVVNRILSTYETSLRRLLAELVEAGDRSSAKAVADIAHTLKSSSASVGAAGMAARCSDVEATLRGGDATRLPSHVADLLAEGDRALAAVRAMLRT